MNKHWKRARVRTTIYRNTNNTDAINKSRILVGGSEATDAAERLSANT
jgi:hypothetical protein